MLLQKAIASYPGATYTGSPYIYNHNFIVQLTKSARVPYIIYGLANSYSKLNADILNSLMYIAYSLPGSPSCVSYLL